MKNGCGGGLGGRSLEILLRLLNDPLRLDVFVDWIEP